MDYKVCTKCEKTFPATNEFFYRNKTCRFGLTSQCKVCIKKYDKEYHKKTYVENADRIKEYGKKYRAKNIECIRIRLKKYRKNNQEKIKISTREYCKNNKEKRAIYSAKWWKDNPDKRVAYKAKRRARKLNQSPILTKTEDKQIKLIYKRSQELGPGWHVDHIIPLSKGGLHHPTNLQIVTASYNLQKSDKLNFRLPTEKEVFNGESDRYM